MVLGVDTKGVNRLAMEVGKMLEGKGFVVSLKSKVEPTQELTCLGKTFVLIEGNCEDRVTLTTRERRWRYACWVG